MLKFDVGKTVKYWLEGAEYDMDVAKALYEKKKYPYALFMGHLALEKLLKALVVKTTQQHAPYTHSLEKLAKKAKIDFPEQMQIRLREFMEFHVEARYPDEQKAFYKKCSRSYTEERFTEIKEVFEWSRSKLAEL